MKALDALGILLALFLSVVLVIMLIAAPLTLSALSVVEPKNIVDVMVKGLTEDMESAAADPQEAYVLQKLAKSSKENTLAESVMEVLEEEGIDEIAGKKIDEDVIIEVLASGAMTEVFEAYANDVANALAGDSKKQEFTEKNVKKIVRNNMDEILDAVEDAGVSLSKSDRAEAEEKINSAMERNASKLVNALPEPEEIAESVMADDFVADTIGAFLSLREAMKTAIVVTIVVLSVLIFFLRFPGFRGMRWLATDLFIAGGFNVIICTGLGVGLAAAKDLAEDLNSSAAEGIVKSFLNQLNIGVIVRTAIMLVAAIALLVGYYLLKKAAKKKADKEEKPAIVMPTITLAPMPAPAPAPVAAPVFTAMTVEPELVDEAPAEPAEETSLEETKVFAEEPAAESSVLAEEPAADINLFAEGFTEASVFMDDDD